MVKLTAAERDALRARARAEGVPMASVLRSAIEPAPTTRPARSSFFHDDRPPTRAGVLAMLAQAAEGGSVAAMVALERALRLGGSPSSPKTGPVTVDELRAGLRAVR
jgi:hypothetical protein